MIKCNHDAALEAITLGDFLELMRKAVDVLDPRSLVDLMEPLFRLSRNDKLLIDAINDDLATFERPGTSHFYGSQSCLLFVQEPLRVRINIWPVLPADARRNRLLSRLNSYSFYHDHNFSFITANYFGPGYETDMYRYDKDKIVGFPGERVELEHLGRHQLGRTTTMFYEGFSDIHRQFEPALESASINLILTSPRDELSNQHYFDPPNARISGYVESSSSRRVASLVFAGMFGNEKTAELLCQIVESSPCVRTCVEAARQLQTLKGESAIGSDALIKIRATPLGRALWDEHLPTVGQLGAR